MYSSNAKRRSGINRLITAAAVVGAVSIASVSVAYACGRGGTTTGGNCSSTTTTTVAAGDALKTGFASLSSSTDPVDVTDPTEVTEPAASDDSTTTTAVKGSKGEKGTKKKHHKSGAQGASGRNCGTGGGSTTTTAGTGGTVVTTEPTTNTTEPATTSTVLSPTTLPTATTLPTTSTTAVAPTTTVPISGGGAKACTSPTFTTSDTNGGQTFGDYYVHNNMWNPEGTTETLYACGADNWYVTATAPNSTSVKTFPNVHKDYDNKAISSFKTLNSSFAATSPHTGIYDVAYDIWVNGVADANSTEFMIWTDNYKQVPSGDKVATTTVSGVSYDVWKTSDSKYIAFVPAAPVTSGNIDLLSVFNFAISKGWLAANSTVGQIDYGVEICSTNGAPATFKFTDFSITES